MVRSKASALLVALFLLGLSMVARSEAVSVQDEGTAGVVAEGIVPAPELGLFVPKPQLRGCFTDCVNEWAATMCAGLSGTEYQQCVNDGAEGCRCYCKGICP